MPAPVNKPVTKPANSENRLSKPLLIAIGIDAVLVLIFAATGRSSHGEANSLGGILTTLWPFWLGLALGHVIAYRWHRPLAVNWTGIVLWASTVAFGLLFRVVSGQGAALTFVMVATLVLGVFLMGWRALYQRLRRAKQRAQQR